MAPPALQLRQRTVKRPRPERHRKLQLGGDGETRRGGNIRRRGMRIEAEYGSASSKPLASSATCAASATVSAKTDTVSFNRQAGTTPRLDNRPLVGFSPTMLLNPAGTRPDPAVSVPSANGTRPRATTEAEPGWNHR